MIVRAHPIRMFQTVLHLALLGGAGFGVISLLLTLLSVGIGLTPVLGIGLLLLVGLVYALYGVSWFETARVSGLYGLGLALPAFAVRTRPGFGGWLRSLWAQLRNGQMWRAVGNFTIASLLGLILLACVSQLLAAFSLIFAGFGAQSPDTVFLPFGFLVPTETAPLWGLLVIALNIGAVVGLALLHRVLSISIIRAGYRTAALAAEAKQSDEQRAGAVRAADVERTRIERDLHDGVQPRLVSIGMTLGLAQQQIDTDPAAAKQLVAEAHTSTKAAITELRQLARGIHTAVLDDRGLDAALSALAGRSHVPVALDVRLPEPGEGRSCRDAEAAVYFCVAEALTNTAKHSRAGSCRVTVRLRTPGDGQQVSMQYPNSQQGADQADHATHSPMIWARIEDDGVGGATMTPGGGLDGIANRVLAVGGTFRFDSPVGGPTAVEVSVPCAF